MKRILITATEIHMYKFWLPHIKYLTECGYKVDLVCSRVLGKWEMLQEKLKEIGDISLRQVGLVRNPLSFHNITGYRQMKKYITEGNYDLVLTNEPVMGFVTRLAARKARKNGTKVMYVVHGFHFWSDAPKKNWIVFYTAERFASNFTDVLVTINNEDYNRAQKKMKAKKVKRIHGIGIDLTTYKFDPEVRKIKRAQLGVKDDEFMLFSAAELLPGKNLPVAIDAVKMLDNPKIKYFIRGEGKLDSELKNYIKQQNLQDNVFMMGFGKDIKEMNSAADAFVFPTLREGLSVALLESIACKLPVICSSVRGNVDLITDGKGGYLCDKHSPKSFADRIKYLMEHQDEKESLVAGNEALLEQYRIENVVREIENIIKEEIS